MPCTAFLLEPSARPLEAQRLPLAREHIISRLSAWSLVSILVYNSHYFHSRLHYYLSSLCAVLFCRTPRVLFDSDRSTSCRTWTRVLYTDYPVREAQRRRDGRNQGDIEHFWGYYSTVFDKTSRSNLLSRLLTSMSHYLSVHRFKSCWNHDHIYSYHCTCNWLLDLYFQLTKILLLLQ